MYDLLKGTRVLDLTSVVLGPVATQYLGDFGADVIKVEPQGGDIFRFVKPARSEDMGAGFLNMNRNKRSVCLNLKDPEDQAQFTTLLSEADVLVHNMRGAAAARLGLSPDEIKKAYPRLVYCTAPGFGSSGRYAEAPAYDDIIQAASGIADLNKDSTGAPRFIPTIVCDKIGGMHLAMAVLAGLVRQKETGEGCMIEVPMFEGMVSFLMSEQLSGESFDPPLGPMGYERLQSPYRRPYRTKDGYVSVLPYSGAHWQKVLSFLESDLADAEWVQSASERSGRVGELYALLADAMPDQTSAEWLDIFRARDIPCTPIHTVQDLLADPHLKDVGLFRSMDHPTEGTLRSVRMPFWVDGLAEEVDRPAPSRPAQADPIAWRQRD